jgi:hypothetical protein
MNNNACTLSTEIGKCASYSDNFICNKRDTGYLMNNSIFRELDKAVNCFKYTNINTCEKCEPADNNKGLKTDINRVTSCVDKNVAICKIPINIFPLPVFFARNASYWLPMELAMPSLPSPRPS